jgi:CheY-like chemotaxis protein
MSQRVDILSWTITRRTCWRSKRSSVDPSFNLVRASSAAPRCKEVLRCDFALILLDVAMPDLDGYETAS